MSPAEVSFHSLCSPQHCKARRKVVKERSEDGALRQASQLALTEIRRDREPRDREGADLGSSYLCMPLALFLLVYVRIQMFKDDTSTLVTHRVPRSHGKPVVSWATFLG